MAQGKSYNTTADVSPAVFVKVSGVNAVATCGAGERAIGVAHEGTVTAPIPGVTGYAALSGYPLTVYGEGETCEVVCAEAITAGAAVMSNASGQALNATSTNFINGYAVNTTAASGQKVKIVVTLGGKYT